MNTNQLLIQGIAMFLLRLCVVADDTVMPKIVNTLLGPVKGFKTTNKITQKNLFEFRGIPYGKPPVGPLRFQKPVAVDTWPNVLDATEFGAGCPQSEMFADFKPPKMSEDCLFLNVYVPENSEPDKKLPVMVWIHGGSLLIGFGHQYDGGVIATEGNVIVVTINYRLDVFGFLALNHPAAKGNYGLWDQKLALEWVHEYIAEFGGDPNAVTIFGESAGGWSASYQSLLPSNKGLFQRVICQSGVAGRTSFLGKDKVNENIKQLSEQTECKMDDMDEFVNCLREMPIEDLLKATNTFDKQPEDRMQFQQKYQAVVDGELYQDHPLLRLEDRSSDESQFFRSLDFIAGYTSNEAALMGSYVQKNMQEYYDFNSTEGIPKRVVRNAMIYPYVEQFFHNDSRIKEILSDFYLVYDSDEQSIKAIDFFNDVWFGISTANMLHYHATLGGNTYQYQFSKKCDLQLFGEAPSWAKGCAHGGELQFQFDVKQIFPSMNGSEFTEEEVEFSRNFIRYWTAFAKTGVPDEWDGAVQWKQFSPDERYYLDFDSTITLNSDLDMDMVN